MLHPWLAHDLARERAQELERAASRHRLLANLDENMTSAWPARMRGFAALPLRAFSRATYAISDAACTAATRLEGRSA